ncbi:MAG: FAD-binding protein [Rhodocyclaceae bacterium]|nr:FAD-binding protein [Rhodocyclaceae bacterium]
MSAEALQDRPLTDASAYVGEPGRIGRADGEAWDDEADVLVVGFGGAGACAALEARNAGADVLVLERFEGGGATALSGGVYYGGGTRQLREAGYNDTPEAMYRYLKLEIGDTVRDETLRRYCDQSAANLEWLERHGVSFGSTVFKEKGWPPVGYHLYYSGNEKVPGYKDVTPPVPRGHRAVGPSFSGGVLFEALRRATLAAGVRVRTQTAAARLVVDADGVVVGVEANALPPGSPAARKHRSLFRRVNAYLRFFPERAVRAGEEAAAIEGEAARPIRIRARRGVILSSGSFTFNRAMVQRHAPKYLDGLPIGALGCDGSGVKLGTSVGGATRLLDKVSAWRSIAPPSSFVEGMVVNRAGRRFVAEDVYLGKLGYHIAEDQGGRAWVVVDRKAYRDAFAATIPGSGWLMFGAPLLANLLFNMKKGRTLAELAQRCGIDASGLEATARDYNALASAGQDALGKGRDYVRPLGAGPYHALDISIGSRGYPCPTIPMGGLVVDEDSGAVMRPDGTTIPGLYAAGRAAVGIPSGFYVSGTAIADCVFSGRRAGRHAAGG